MDCYAMHHPHSQSERERGRVGLHHSSSFICPLWPNVISFHFSYRRRPNFGMGAIRRRGGGGTKGIRVESSILLWEYVNDVHRRPFYQAHSLSPPLNQSCAERQCGHPRKTYCIIGEEKCRVLIPASPFCQRYGIISLQLCGKRQVAC